MHLKEGGKALPQRLQGVGVLVVDLVELREQPALFAVVVQDQLRDVHRGFLLAPSAREVRTITRQPSPGPMSPRPLGMNRKSLHNRPQDIQAERTEAMAKHRIFTTSVASVYPLYVAKAEKKGRTRAEVDEVIRWLTGFSQQQLDAQLAAKSDFETFFAQAPAPGSARAEIKGMICGVRVEEVAEPLMREIRYLDKLIDELARGRPMEKILGR